MAIKPKFVFLLFSVMFGSDLLEKNRVIPYLLQHITTRVWIGLFCLLFCLFVLDFLKFIFYWSSIYQHIAYHPVFTPSSAPLGAHHPVTPTPCPPPFPLSIVRFPELGVSHVLSSSLIFHIYCLPTYFFPNIYQVKFIKTILRISKILEGNLIVCIKFWYIFWQYISK